MPTASEVLLNFLQRSLVNVAGQVFSLLELEHIVLRAHSRAPKFGWVQCPKGRPGDPKTDMGLERAAPEPRQRAFGFCGWQS